MNPVRIIRKSALISFVSLSALFAHYAHAGTNERDFEPHEVEDIRSPNRRRECPAQSAGF